MTDSHTLPQSTDQLGTKAVAIRLGLFYGCIILAFAALAMSSGRDQHWLNRFGGTVVTLSCVVSFLQFSIERYMENRLALQPDPEPWMRLGLSKTEAEEQTKRFALAQRERLERIRRLIFINALASAALGEMLHVFGDVVWERIGG